jgi:ribosomal protein S18 acetylase RimI-like enzyme
MLRIQNYQDIKHSVSVKEAFAEIFDKSEIPYFDGFQSSGLSYVCTARTGAVQAFILVKDSPSEVTNYEIAFLGVLPRYRGKGYAKRLVDMVKNATSGKGLWLNVLDSNVGALALYHKLDFDVYEKFTSAAGDPATKFTFGVEYPCYHCKKALKPKDTIWQEIPTSLVVTPYGLKPVSTLQPNCWHCRTRVEP